MSNDIFVPESLVEDAFVGPLSTITYVTADEETAVKLLVEGMGLEASDWYIPSDIEKPDIDAYFGFKSAEPWKAKLFFRTDEGQNIQIRLIVVDRAHLQIRPNIDGTYVGGLSIGFPLSNSDAREANMRSLGFPSVVGVKRLQFSSPTGDTYISEEVHFLGPENIYILGVKRPDIFVPVGPLNAMDEIGAPAYSAICTFDCDAAMGFYKDILGYEIRRDMTMQVGDNSGLKLHEGSTERFIQAFAPGSSTGYLVFLNHGEDAKVARGVNNFGPPNRGLSMWSFPSSNIAEVLYRANNAGVIIRQPLSAIKSPFLPDTDTLILEDPGGFPVEIYAI